jgi:predicted  nucleic acid-binding Zn-ribbon protein
MFADIKKVVEDARGNFNKLFLEIREIRMLLKDIKYLLIGIDENTKNETLAALQRKLQDIKERPPGL